MDPLLQIFQQEQGGSAEGQGFGQFYAQGQQLNLQKQHLALQKREEQRLEAEQNVLLPLRQKMLEYENLNRGLEAGQILGDDALTAERNLFIPKVQDLYAQFLQSPDGFHDTKLLGDYRQMLIQNPWAFTAGAGALIKQGTLSAQMERQKVVVEAKDNALHQLQLKYPTLDLRNPDHLVSATRNEAVKELYVRAQKEGKLLNTLPDHWFNQDGTINEQKAVPGMGALPRSETLQSREDIAYQKMQNQLDLMQFKIDHGGGYTPGAAEKDIEYYKQLFREGKLSEDDLSHAIKRRTSLEARPPVEHQLNESAYVDKHIEHLLTETPGMPRPKAIRILKAEFQAVIQGQPAKLPSGAVPTIKKYNPSTGKLE